jgi:hypothetical protein
MNESTVSAIEGAGGQGIAATSSGGELLPLDAAERAVVLKVRDSDTIRRHVFRRIERPDADAYFAATLIAMQRSGQTTENEIDIGSAELKLYERAAVRVAGYGLSDGRDLMQLPNWKSRVPGGHRIRAVDFLIKVTISAGAATQLIDPEYDVVSLDAIWSEGAIGGSMDWYRGLVHRFTPPTDAHWKKFNNFKTRSIAVGGSRAQKTIYPKLDGVLGSFYDELVVSVGGYSFRGEPLADKATVVAQMCPFHKIAAVAALFDKSQFDSHEEEVE